MLFNVVLHLEELVMLVTPKSLDLLMKL